MRLTIRINPERPSDMIEANALLRYRAYQIAIFAITEEMRRRLKHTENPSLAAFSDWVWQMLDEAGIDPCEE